MKLRLSPLERSIRDRVREEVKTSPALWEEYRKRRRTELVERCFVWSIVLPTLLFLVYAVLSLTFPDAPFAPPSRPLEKPVPVEGMLLAASLIVTGVYICKDHASDLRHMGALSLFPYRDELFKRSRIRRELASSLGLACFAALFYRFLLWAHSLPTSALLHALAATTLYIPVTLAIYLLVDELSRSWRQRRMVYYFGLGCFFVGAGSVNLVAAAIGRPSSGQFLANACPYALATLPGGWINGAVYYGVVKHNSLSWLYLVPACMTIGVVAYLIRRPLVIREFIFEANKLTAIIFTDGRLIASSRYRRELVYGDGTLSKEVTPAESPDPERLVAEVFRNQDEPKRSDWLDDRLARWLSPRERAVLRSWSGQKSLYTRQFYVLVVGLIIASVVGYWLPPGASLQAVSLITFGAICFGSVRDLLVDYESVCRYPIRFAEPLTIKLKARLFMAPLFLAFAIPTAQVVAAIHGRSTLDAIVAGVLPVLWSLGLLAVGVLSQLVINDDLRAGAPLEIGKFVCAAALLFMALGLSLGSIYLRQPGVRLLCLAGMPLLSWTAWLFCSWAFHELPIDVVRKQTKSR